MHSVSRTISASPETIWSILTDVQRYPEWDPGTERVEGQVAPGEKIEVYARINPDRTFPVTVTEFEPGRRMTWTSGMPLGLFKGERTFTLTPRGERTDFSMQEVFTGLLLPIIGRTIPDLSATFEQFADALKARAEAASG